MDRDAPLLEVGQAGAVCFDQRHRRLAQGDAALIDGAQAGNDGVGALPGHRSGEREDGVERVEEGAVPVLLQAAPAALEGVVLAVVGRGVRQAHGAVLLLGERHEAVHALGALAVALRAVVQVAHQRGDVRAAVPHGRPPLRQAVDQAVTRHRGGHAIEEACVHRREEEPDRGNQCLRLAVLVGSGDGHAVGATTRAWPDLDRRLGLQRDPQRRGRGGGGLIDRVQLGEEGVGLGNLFWGCVFTTCCR
jgi:hypothetical protein